MTVILRNISQWLWIHTDVFYKENQRNNYKAHPLDWATTTKYNFFKPFLNLADVKWPKAVWLTAFESMLIMNKWYNGSGSGTMVVQYLPYNCIGIGTMVMWYLPYNGNLVVVVLVQW